MDPTIDQETAWSLVRAVPRGLSAGTSARVRDPIDPEVWIEVDSSGAWAASRDVDPDAYDVFELYLPLQVESSWVIGQIGQSLDGRIATESGHSRYVTGPEDIRRLHRLRALADGVIVGAGTVEADDPRLTVRAVEGSNPVRVILDPDGRLAESLTVFSDGASATLTVRRAPAQGDNRVEPALAPPTSGDRETLVNTLVLPTSGNRGFDPLSLLEALRRRGLERVLVEGGGVTVSRFLAAGALDRLHVAVSPLILGSGRPAFSLPPITTLDEALRPPCRHFRLGNDILFDLDLGGGRRRGLGHRADLPGAGRPGDPPGFSRREGGPTDRDVRR